MTDEQKAVRTAWVEALRSGEYKKGIHSLRRNDTYCCLGVLCDVSGVGEWKSIGGTKYTTVYAYTTENEANHTTLPELVMNHVGLASDIGRKNEGILTSLVAANDGGLNFNQIADIIEAEPEGLFHD